MLAKFTNPFCAVFHIFPIFPHPYKWFRFQLAKPGFFTRHGSIARFEERDKISDLLLRIWRKRSNILYDLWDSHGCLQRQL